MNLIIGSVQTSFSDYIHLLFASARRLRLTILNRLDLVAVGSVVDGLVHQVISVAHLRAVPLVSLRSAMVIHQQRVLRLVYCVLGVVLCRQRFVIHQFGEARLHITV